MELTDCQAFEEEYHRKRKRNRHFDAISGASERDSPDTLQNFTPSDRFRVETFNVIIDTVLVALSKRLEAYKELASLFGSLNRLNVLSAEEIHTKSKNLVK